MKQKITILLISMIMVFSPLLSPVFSNQKADAGENVNQVTISYWSIYPATDPYTPRHQEYIDRFVEDNPNIRIDHQGTNFWDYFTKLRTAQAGGDVIDVYWQDIVSVKFRAKNNVAANLKPYLDRDDVDMSQWTENDLDTASYNGGIYAMVFSSDSRILYYNKDHFSAAGLDPESPPKTFDQLKEYAELLTIYETEERRRLIQVGFHPRLGNNAIQQIVWPMGGTFFDNRGNPTVNIQENIDAVQWWIDIARSYPLRAMNGFTSEHSDGTGKDQSFLLGATSIVIDGDWLAWQIEKINPGLNYGVSAVPYTSEEYRSNWSGGFTLEMSARSQGDQAQAAWEFLKYMTGVGVQSEMNKTLDFLPANTKAIEVISQTANENQRQIFEEFPYRRHVDYVEAAPEWWIYVQEQLSKAEGGEITAQEAMDAAQQNLEAVIEEYEITNVGSEIPVVPLVAGGIGLIVVILIIVLVKSKQKKNKTS